MSFGLGSVWGGEEPGSAATIKPLGERLDRTQEVLAGECLATFAGIPSPRRV